MIETLRSTQFIPVGCILPVCLPRGGLPSERRGLPAPWHCGKADPLWTELLTHACENITFLQLHLRAVTNINFFKRSLDPMPELGFPGGRQPQKKLRESIFGKYFAEICMKLKEFRLRGKRPQSTSLMSLDFVQ